ncbi:hypothetical protein KZI27_15770 [Curtobacterium sp. TC1]|uniref:hypothetical protein n=1 Tax=Curtobacterium TaxID=2034 RepID=UPI0011AA5D30|nr:MULTISPECIES: hypothetical protein [Curtobacterium]QZQ57493.1 hypothetical protein KZI27_15770 [Curtobacterium sp. TC1]
MSNITPPSVPNDDGALEGPDVEVPTTDSDGTVKPAGLGDDSTIPNHPDGLAAGYSDTDSHFNPEEDTPTQ